ncbi:MAG: fibrinogen-like YCDxxxxGGGW domain-containing protein, partial [Bradymonadaceae bacterium]
HNSQETDVDCGGSTCPSCPVGADCAGNQDCRTGVCNNGTCRSASCSDNVHNGRETDLDCGGSKCGPCDIDDGCRLGTDCKTGVCRQGACASPSCEDSVRNGSETDVDCGGSRCGSCGIGGQCQANSDCHSGVCESGTCQAPTCSDGVDNGTETDADCGGGCQGCTAGQSCKASGDCISGVCQSGTCRAPDCADRVKNGSETDVDCGGPDCPGCGTGANCSSDADCRSDVCKNGACVACKNGDTRTTNFVCGYKNRGVVTKVCQNNTWVDECKGVWFASCREINDAKSGASSGTYEIDIDGSGGQSPMDVHCDMSTAGGGWTRFWWYNQGKIQSVQDFLRSDLAQCSPSADMCFATMPVSSPRKLLVKTDERNGGSNTNSWAVWKFGQNGTDADDAAQAAFTVKKVQPRGATSGCWNPVQHTNDYDPNQSGCSEEFWFESNNGVMSFNLDDDTAWAKSAFQAGRPHGKNEDINNVDCLETDNASSVQRHCELYYK